MKRQIRGGAKSGIPDIVGIDNDGNICIVEMKNVVIDASIISQVLQYAFWAESNPDSIRALWLECANKPDGLSISWDTSQVRIVVIAPAIRPSTLDIVKKIDYPVDLIEINRWVEADNQLLLVRKLEPEEKKGKVKPIHGLQIYDEDYYKQQYNKESVKYFMKYVNEVEKIIHEKGWGLETKFNKHYCAFNAGFFNVFGIQWIGTKTFAFFIKLSEDEAKASDIIMTKYESLWKQATYYIDPQKTKTNDFIKLFEMAYKKRTGD